jgi:hypothetical protein
MLWLLCFRRSHGLYSAFARYYGCNTHRVNVTIHGIAQGRIDHSMPLDQAFTDEGIRLNAYDKVTTSAFSACMSSVFVAFVYYFQRHRIKGFGE